MAVIHLTEDGVQVKPVIDLTKIGITRPARRGRGLESAPGLTRRLGRDAMHHRFMIGRVQPNLGRVRI